MRGIILLFLLLSGCATSENHHPPIPLVKEIDERNYVIGARQTTFVGDTVLRVRRFFVERSDASTVRAIKDFKVRGGAYDIRFGENQSLPIDGVEFIDGRRFFVVSVETTQFAMPTIVRLLVDEEGKIRPKALEGGAIFSFRADPNDGRLVPEFREAVVKSKPFTNYDIVFNGSDGRAMHFTYREYSAEDLARTAFFQDLSYPLTAKVIRFRNLLLDVHHLDEQAITWSVRSDHSDNAPTERAQLAEPQSVVTTEPQSPVEQAH